MGLVQDITPWNQPAAKVPTRQAEEQLTAVRFEHATGTGEEQQREPVSILKPTPTPTRRSKTPQGKISSLVHLPCRRPSSRRTGTLLPHPVRQGRWVRPRLSGGVPER